MTSTTTTTTSTSTSPVTSAVVRKNAYVDSVTLLQISAELLSADGVHDAALVMATELNRQVLSDAGLLVGEAEAAGLNDLIIVVRTADDRAALEALQLADRLLSGRRGLGLEGEASGASASKEVVPHSLRSAHRADPQAMLAVISVPGPYAAGEARQALAEGLHVFLFSDNVTLADEVDLKRRAREQDLLMMGPDCGTAILNGVGLGFANVVRRGRVGLVGASGTGLQEVTSLLHQNGEGISHAIGTGGRDLATEVGGSTTLQALRLLADDASTEVIVLVSKPAAPVVAERILRAAADTRKPVVACLLGLRSTMQAPDGVELAHNLYAAARMAASAGATWPDNGLDLPPVPLGAQQRQVRGLFCGGTLAEEAAEALGEQVEGVLTDFGDDRYTQGRAHPMIDPTLRNQAIVEAGGDPRVAVLLLDVILGIGSHADPAGATVPAIRAAVARANAEGRQLPVVAHIVGTDRDPQGLAGQEATLRAAGVHLAASNYYAALAARALVEAARVTG